MAYGATCGYEIMSEMGYFHERMPTIKFHFPSSCDSDFNFRNDKQ